MAKRKRPPIICPLCKGEVSNELDVDLFSHLMRFHGLMRMPVRGRRADREIRIDCACGWTTDWQRLGVDARDARRVGRRLGDAVRKHLEEAGSEHFVMLEKLVALRLAGGYNAFGEVRRDEPPEWELGILR